MISKYGLTMKIRKERITDENRELYNEVHGLECEDGNQLTFIINQHVFNKDVRILKYYRTCLNFDISRYEEYLIFRRDNPKDSMSMEFHKLKYGKDWEPLYYNRKDSVGLTYEDAIEKHGLERANDMVKSRSQNLESFIARHGQEIGSAKFKEFCKSNEGNLTLERQIEIHGVNAGITRYVNIRKNFSNKNLLSNYIRIYGEEDGTRRYDSRRFKQAKTLSETGKKLGPDHFNNTSLEKLISKHGKDRGEYLYNEYINKIRNTMERTGRWRPLSQLSEFNQYKVKVKSVTEKQDIENLENFEKRARAGDEGAYHLDHIISVKMGFTSNLPPEKIGHIDNLKFIPAEINCSKGPDSYTYLGYNYFEKEESNNAE